MSTDLFLLGCFLEIKSIGGKDAYLLCTYLTGIAVRFR